MDCFFMEKYGIQQPYMARPQVSATETIYCKLYKTNKQLNKQTQTQYGKLGCAYIASMIQLITG